MSFWSTVKAPSLPRPPALPRPLDLLLGTLLGILGFVLPMSVAGVSLVLAALLLFTLLQLPRVLACAPWRDPVVATGLALLAFIAVHTLWTSGFTMESKGAINRYHELLMVAVLLALFRMCSRREIFFQGLAWGATVYATIHWAAVFSAPLAAYLEPRRISAGFALALCAFVLLEHARATCRPWVGRLASAYLACTVLFAIEGRTGHVVLLLLVACAAWMHSPARWRWAAMLALPLLAAAIALNSAAVQKRMGETMAGEQQAPGGGLTSTGIRMELLRTAGELAVSYFPMGAGYANYGRLHDEVTQARLSADPVRRQYLNAHWVHSSNPHNEYLMQLVGGGGVALALFCAWLVLPMLRRPPDPAVCALLVGVALAFAVGCLFNSLLMDYVEGHLYGCLLAWLLAQADEAPPGAPAPQA